MDHEDLRDWRICWKVNLWWCVKSPATFICVGCETKVNQNPDSLRSNFWSCGTQCLAGHLNANMPSPLDDPLGICSKCEQDYILHVVQGKKQCKSTGCRRTIRINEQLVKCTLFTEAGTLGNFLALLKRYKRYECEIHSDEVTYDGDHVDALKPPTPECEHDRKVCNPCLKLMFEKAIMGGRIETLLCPDLECRKPVPPETIRANVSQDIFKIYSRKLSQKSLGENPKFRWCPCGHGQLHSPGESQPEWSCLKCKKRQCFVCRDTDCSHLREIDAKKRQDKAALKHTASIILTQSKEEREKQKRIREADLATRREQARTSKKCPSCRAPIQKARGCAHMTCKSCRTDFCWCCKVIWRNRQPLHLTGCRVGTQSTVDRQDLDTSRYAGGWDKDAGYDASNDGELWLQASDQ
ncbi:hypothetical protein BDV96DRAFT_353029 [Lophiotrema nucula]|uniref:RBR-type E3 ubiquitin transferase n=1 Tax=Lophiotrema nucula TaxID=690887 RepID=A0A6A5ZLQ3_9PLEO|nr:hypothetical protein BDV96DRAFT_353029 [Lophiotrema nucula]